MRIDSRSAVVVIAIAGMLVAGCADDVAPREVPSAASSELSTGDVVVTEVDHAVIDEVCAAIRSGVETYAGEVTDVTDEVLEDRDEACYTARGNGLLDYAVGMLRVHEFGSGDVRSYSEALQDGSEEAGPCLVYWTTTSDDDVPFNSGPTEFSEEAASGEPYCGAENDSMALVFLTVPGAGLMLEFEATGSLNGRDTDVRQLRDAILTEVFTVVP
ncbi:hypothetical protein [Stackebrandtia albiflava]|uniref:hypothetical protein n=1 Tax=Stackebrandtia albiflava TaxID=406432 RepID=UPI0011BF4520|nr:hypothetical protein [Stackebrandtia albiflava]